MENNKTLRIRTNINEDQYITVNLEQEYDVLEILSMKIDQKGAYKYTVGDYGVVVGRVVANNGFGVPNAKLSLFIAKNETNDFIKDVLYPYDNTLSKDDKGRRYNLLPDNQKDDCHQIVGSFPNKRVMLDEKSVLEVFDEYYRYTTRTNDAGDYMFYGIPTGGYTLHMDLDISDCGKLSQRPRDFIYKGYTIEQFENPNQFKVDTELSSLAQIFTQDITIDVKPFWGDANDNRRVGITRQDIDVSFKFEPTCVFMGSIFTDGPSEGISQKCKPSKRMGEMSELTTGPGTIQIIRKTPANTIEELQIKGTQLIDGNGVWCFQIPMNLDYMMTDEYGNMVPTDSPEKGIPTRCEVRFRLSLEEGSDVDIIHNSKVLVPHNPQSEDELDYAFGSRTKDVSFKSLMWNNVYTVKSYIPRFQRWKTLIYPNKRFTGIKEVNHHKSNNPMPYNNIRIEMPFMFLLMCIVIKSIIGIVNGINVLKRSLMSVIGNFGFIRPYSYVSGFCPELDYWYFAPGMNIKEGKNGKKWQEESVCKTFKDIAAQLDSDDGGDSIVLYEIDSEDSVEGYPDVISEKEWEKLDPKTEQILYKVSVASDIELSNLDNVSTDAKNMLKNDGVRIYLTANKDYLIKCIESNLAQEYEVIKFDFYNDWVNGTIYLPQWKARVKGKKDRRIKGCMNDPSIYKSTRYYVQQCSLSYDKNGNVSSDMNVGCHNSNLRCHKDNGVNYIGVFGAQGGIVHDGKTSLGDSVYYLKPYEFRGKQVVPFFATDIVMLGSLFDCNEYGLPSTFNSLMSTTYQLPPSLALTNLEGDGDSFSAKDGGATLEEIKRFKCGEKEGGDNKNKGIVTSFLSKNGVVPTTMTYSDIEARLQMYEGVSGYTQIDIDYDDIYPITEMSGVDWGYEGVGYGFIPKDDKMLAPGGHFLGMSCWNAETNIRSCVNLKRACEIGTTLSERLEIPVGSTVSEDGDFEITNYLFVAPNGLIAKDQIVDTTFRSAFATMNQNSLKTFVNAYGYKEYDFEYLLPDSFDGCLSTHLNKQEWTKKLETDVRLADAEVIKEMFDKLDVEGDVVMQTGNTIIRNSEVRSDDYVRFRLGDEPKYLIGGRMPVYRNSFYFYFGLKRGATALDLFKSQYYAPCAPQVLSKPKGEMLLSVERPVGDDYKEIMMFNNFQFNLKILLKGTEKGNVKMYTLYRLYTDDYHIIESDGLDSKKIVGFTLPKTTIGGQFTGNDCVVEGVPFGVYEVVVSDEYGTEFVDIVNVGKDFMTISYDKNSIVHYIKTIDNDSLQNDGAIYNEKNPTVLGNGGYIPGDFIISGAPKNSKIKYCVVVKRVTGYDIGDDFRRQFNYECVKNSDEYYIPKTNWYKWYDSKLKRLYLWGYGVYEVWIRSVGDNGYVAEYKYDTFIVNNGITLSFTLGDKNFGLGGISYDTLYKLESKYGEWWNKSEVFSETNDLSEDEKYLLYRTITDYKQFGENGINLHVNYIGDGVGKEVLYGEGSLLSGDSYVVKQGEIMTQVNDANIMTAADEGYVLNTTMIYNTMNENEEGKSRKYPLFYTNANEDFSSWGSVFCEGIFKNGSFTVEKNQEDKYNKIKGILGTSENQKMFLLCGPYKNGDKNLYLVNCKNNDGVLSISLNSKIKYPDDIKIGNGNYKLIHLVKLPVLRKKFGYVGIAVRGINSMDSMMVSNAFVGSQTTGYKIRAKLENRFKISVYDYKFISGDVYNNNMHNFTPDSGKNEYTTRYNGTNILNRDSVGGHEGYIVQIPMEFLNDPNKKEELYTLLKNTNKDSFESGSIDKENCLCQVFSSENQIGGVFYYVLKLN